MERYGTGQIALWLGVLLTALIFIRLVLELNKIIGCTGGLFRYGGVPCGYIFIAGRRQLQQDCVLAFHMYCPFVCEYKNLLAWIYAIAASIIGASVLNTSSATRVGFFRVNKWSLLVAPLSSWVLVLGRYSFISVCLIKLNYSAVMTKFPISV